jgi:uncharacterized protein YndB with AHSA1/START domain
MSIDALSIKTKIQIARLSDDVYESIIDPEKMRNYFIANGSGIMKTGETVLWSFPEFEGSFPIRVKEVLPGSLVSFYWDNETAETLVEIIIESVSVVATTVTVTERSMANNEIGINWLMRNTEGWANFLACMKAYLEYGINLRTGAFDFMKLS